jgi:hypothetical protein
VKLGAAVTVSVTVALCWTPPPFPLTVMGYVPVAVLDPTVIVIVELVCRQKLASISPRREWLKGPATIRS